MINSRQFIFVLPVIYERSNYNTFILNRLFSLQFVGLFDATHANHVLVNEYLPGQGIMAHSDGPLFYPVICTLSCGSHTILEFYEKDAETDGECTAATTTMNDEAKGQESACHRADANNIAAATPKRKLVCQLLIEPGSLLILKDDMYNKYLHSISEVTEDLITNNIANIDRCIGFRNRLGEVVQRGRRISLTIRHVPKTTRLRIKLGH